MPERIGHRNVTQCSNTSVFRTVREEHEKIHEGGHRRSRASPCSLINYKVVNDSCVLRTVREEHEKIHEGGHGHSHASAHVHAHDHGHAPGNRVS